jgi:8-oxo-dGTP diphosphatase
VTASRLYPDRPFLAASVAVLRDGAVLLVARGRPPLQGIFSLPGGLVEPGETLAEAALRELREEVGVEAEMIGFVGPVEIIERDEAGRAKHHFVVCAHAARWLAGEPALGPEALAIRWVAPDEVAALPTTAGLPAIVAGAFALDRALTSS